MKIYISEEDIIKNIQDKFHAIYPYLKLEFFGTPHNEYEGNADKDRLNKHTPLEDIRMIHTFGWLDISPDKTVVALEAELYKNFGLSAQVLRKGHHCWLQTIGTDNLTLEQQNALALSEL